MARQTATARRMPQGKGKKAGSPTVSKRSAARRKAARARKPLRALRGGNVQHMDAVVRVGTAITFAPTGERLRVAKIEDGKITFEKLP